MKGSDIRLVARAAIVERAKALFGEEAMEFIQSQEISRHSQCVAIIGIGNRVIDAIMILRDQATKSNPGVPIDMINVAIKAAIDSMSSTLEAPLAAASNNAEYMGRREALIAAEDIDDNGLYELVDELNRRSQGGK